MRTVTNIEKVTVNVTKDELLNDKWLSFQLLSKKLGEIEQQERMVYKQLRNKFYNSRACKKYKMETIAGVVYIDIDNPMRDNAEASLMLSFKRG